MTDAEPHDWRWSTVISKADGREKPLAVCWRCDWVAWNEVDFAGAEQQSCRGHSDGQVLAQVRDLLTHIPPTVHDGDDLLNLIREAIR